MTPLTVNPVPWAFEITSVAGDGTAPFRLKVVTRAWVGSTRVEETTFYTLTGTTWPADFFTIDLPSLIEDTYTAAGYEYAA